MELTVKQRLMQFVSYLEMGQTRFEDETGLARGYLSKLKREPSPSKILSIVSRFPQLNKDWLLTGEGEMLVKDEPHPVKSFTHGVPYYDVDFRLGFDLMMNDQTTRPDYLIDFAPYNKCDVWCNARGDSMAPTIANGDIIALKEIADPSFLANDEIYAVVTTNDMRTIKRVRDEGDSLLLIPDNKAYSDQRLPKTLIDKVYKVVGCMKMF